MSVWLLENLVVAFLLLLLLLLMFVFSTIVTAISKIADRRSQSNHHKFIMAVQRVYIHNNL